MNFQQDLRSSLVQFLQWELLGPAAPDETLDESPRTRYSCGVLFPRQQEIDEAESDSYSAAAEDEAEGTEDKPSKKRTVVAAEDALDVAVQLANANYPAALGISFIARPTEGNLIVLPVAAVYRKFQDKPEANSEEDAPRQWRREQLKIAPIRVKLTPTKKREIFDIEVAPKLNLSVIARRRDDKSFLVTTSIYNANLATSAKRPEVEQCFFQVGLVVRDSADKCAFQEYRLAEKLQLDSDPEEASLRLLYRNRKAFAVGHGCAADWNTPDGNFTNEVRTNVVPTVVIPPIEPYSAPSDTYDMYFLSGADEMVTPDTILKSLSGLTEEYGTWIKTQKAEIRSLPEDMQAVANRHMTECASCLNRLENGIELLRKDKQSLEAFMLANRVMLMQQAHARRPRRGVADKWTPLPDNYRPADNKTGRWRCFQLAFILMNLRSLANDGAKADDPRRLVDLIWFPTGGGKTEAYLGLSAFAIFLRRLRNPEDVGCTVLMRYTLRLLTSQQFTRAAAMICACELIRRKMETRLGEIPISIGLWVGLSLTPNKRTDAVYKLNAWCSGKEDLPFQILTCPWCGTELDNRSHPGYRRKKSPVTVIPFCRAKECPFSNSKTALPIWMIDEDIYDEPPSLIIGTVDKFAMLAWFEKAGAILGAGKLRGPDLIIQDELHLISGPLGSLVGLYESVIELICSAKGKPPKIIASTATIRRAEQQCRNLYNRKTNIFPPYGLDVGDSFFARENKGSVGRMYLGVFGTAAPSFVTASLRTVAALLQGCRSVELPSGSKEDARDPYWTLVWYFNSLRELGHSSTLVDADVREYIRVIARRLKLDRSIIRRIGAPEEMTSRRTADEIPTLLKRLDLRYPDRGAVDVLLATNMLSVGIDIPRLGLMTVAGQPKTTSEYIQATSRVGRSAAAPGLIVTMYSPNKPRDRSHYEHFRAYHEAFYRFVEPTSVTPFSLPALDRALHALIVIAVRHLAGVVAPETFSPSQMEVKKLRAWLKARCEQIDDEHVDYLLQRFDAVCNDWTSIKPTKWGGFGDPPEDANILMYPAGKPGYSDDDALPWATLTSMRSVDIECQAKVLQQYAAPLSDEEEEGENV